MTNYIRFPNAAFIISSEPVWLLRIIYFRRPLIMNVMYINIINEGIIKNSDQLVLKKNLRQLY